MTEFGERLFTALLLRDDGAPLQRLTLPADVSFPPRRIRVPAEISGVAVFEVFELMDARQWPDSVQYRLTSTVPRSPSSAELPEQGQAD
ncbi:hypothetical protein [Leifsonia sp. SIMBA_070]|uniref:hypothetical protein n=1 Tax=Leifsonia sp. SIMBA_070 TaxID=3085810 RepID=UPI00397A1387